MGVLVMSVLSWLRAVSASLGANTAEASWDLLDTIQAVVKAPSYHLLFEAALIFGIIALLLRKSDGPTRPRLTKKEEEELLADWKPEPLVPPVKEDDYGLWNVHNRIVDSKVAKFVSINGQRCLNLASLNFLGMIGRPEIEEEAVKTLRKYGVGTCGPRGFYGTMDVHLEIEDKLAQFMGVEEACVYSYGFATTASAIPAYSKRGDVIFCDEGVCFSVQKGLQASRSKVHFFKHNDMEHLERLLQEQQKEDVKNPKKAKVTRRFLVVEGLYMNHGDICPLPKIVELKWKYKVRIFLDESISFGVLGKTGRGVTEYYDIPVDDIDLVCVSLENSIAAIGGFTCGRAYVVDHQRLSGLGYSFSASQPAMLVTAAMKALSIMQEQPDLLLRLEENCRYFHEEFKKIPGLKVVGEKFCPIKHLQLDRPASDRQEIKRLLFKIVNMAEAAGIALVQANYLETEELFLPPPSIRLSVNSELSREEIYNAVQEIAAICDVVLAEPEDPEEESQESDMIEQTSETIDHVPEATEQSDQLDAKKLPDAVESLPEKIKTSAE